MPLALDRWPATASMLRTSLYLQQAAWWPVCIACSTVTARIATSDTHLDERNVQVGGCDLAELGVQPAAPRAPGREEVHHHQAMARLALQQRPVVLLTCGYGAHVGGREVPPPASVCTR
jgi:hypothetical protein